MDWFSTLIAILVGIFLRLALPIAVTILIVLFLKWLDRRWQQEVFQESPLLQPAPNPGCWDIRNCPEEMRRACEAYQHPELPCWQVLREKNGRLQERCLLCEIFRQAPLPAAP